MDNRKHKFLPSRTVLLVLSVLVALSLLHCESGLIYQAIVVQSEQKHHASLETTVDCNESVSSSVVFKPRSRIAIVTGFVSDKNNSDVRLNERFFNHLINKACYTDIWGYDLIFYSSWGFPNATKSQYWLQWGSWHRVPHLMAILQQYDWVVYVDTDWIVQDLMYPIDSLIHDWELHNQNVRQSAPFARRW
jgi:hypothetical protein